MDLYVLITILTTVYGLLAGFIGRKTNNILERKCGNSKHGGCEHDVPAFFNGLLWPIMLPVVGGIFLANIDWEGRTERKRAKEIEQAEHDAVVAEIKAREHAALDRELALVKSGRL